MTTIQPIRTDYAVIQIGDEAKRYQTLQVKGKVDENSVARIDRNGVCYRKTKLELNGKTEYMYIASDKDADALSTEEKKACDPDLRCTDGKDDGNISGEEMFLSALKGIWKPIKSMFNFSSVKDSLWSCAKIAGAVALAATCVFVPVVGVVLGTIGCILGAATAVVGGIQAKMAKTDAQAKHAWENIGNGAFTAITSALGLKAMKGAAATKAAAVENATGQTTGTVNKLGGLSNFSKGSDTIKTYGPLAKAYTKVCTGLKNAKDTLAAPFRRGMGDTVSNLNKYSGGFAKAKIKSNWGVFDSGITKADVSLNKVDDLCFLAETALKWKDASGAPRLEQSITTAFNNIAKAKAIIPYLPEAEQAQAVAMISDTAAKLDAIPAMTTSLKGVGAAALVAEENDLGVRPFNMFSTPKTKTVYKLS